MALPYSHAEEDAAEDMSEEARSILAEVDALLADGETPLPERLARLRALVRKVRPWASGLARMARNHVLRCPCTPPPAPLQHAGAAHPSSCRGGGSAGREAAPVVTHSLAR
jgi:hypothetical protein